MKRTTIRKQSFAIRAPEAADALLAGDFTHWQQNPIHMKRDKNGVWKTSVSLPPGTYEYRFLVDGHWLDDPECGLRVANPFGSENMVRVVE